MADPVQFVTPNNMRVQPVPNKLNVPGLPIGARALSMTFDFSAALLGAVTTYAVDLENVFSRKEIDKIETVYIHNHSGSLVNMRPDGLLTNIRCPAFSQGYFPVSFLDPPRFTIQGGPAGQNPTQIVFYNFPIPPLVWPSGFFNAKVGSNVTTASAPSPIDVPNYAATKAVTIGGGATAIDNLIFDPGANAAFFMNWIDVSFSGDAATGVAAATVTVSVSDGTSIGRTFMQKNVRLPASGSPGTGIIPVWALDNMNYISQMFGNTLHIELSAALTAGKLNVSAGVGKGLIASPL